MEQSPSWKPNIRPDSQDILFFFYKTWRVHYRTYKTSPLVLILIHMTQGHSPILCIHFDIILRSCLGLPVGNVISLSSPPSSSSHHKYYVLYLVPKFSSIFVLVCRNLFVLLICNSVSVLAIVLLRFYLNVFSTSACRYLFSGLPGSAAFSVVIPDFVFGLVLASWKSKYIYWFSKDKNHKFSPRTYRYHNSLELAEEFRRWKHQFSLCVKNA
jgi:hypothetical protein